MKRSATAFKICATIVLTTAISGCESTDSGSSSVSGGVYYGTTLYDPWYYGGYDYPPDVIVTPPDRPSRPPQPTQPIYNPSRPRPTPMPSIPATPRASFR